MHPSAHRWRRGVQKDYLDKKSTYENLVSQVAQKHGRRDIARAKDDTALKQAEDELKRAQLEVAEERNRFAYRCGEEPGSGG